MALLKYKEKRNFKESPEPKGGKSSDSDKLRFVVQKHAASHLHYDFRLEAEGVLKSWAVPKGPSTDPDVKRLAVMVEDHPFDYRNFEGVIPSGYGAGTVIIWDEGFYELVGVETKDKKTLEKELRKGIYSGKLHIKLHGKKLKGEYALVKTHVRGQNSWLFFKVKDKYVSKEDITLKDKSVISKKTLEQVAKTYDNPVDTNVLSGKGPSKNKRVKKSSSDEIISKGKRSKFPEKISPMLATLIDKPFNKEGWINEVKWDGYRTIAFCNKKKVHLKSRNDKSYNEKFYPVHKAVQEWNLNAVIDGEVVVFNKNGLPDFGAIQNWKSEADGDIYYYVFDLLWFNGKNLMDLPLINRREILMELIPSNGIIRMSESFGNNGIELFESAKKIGFEGIIAKNEESKYKPGVRSDVWLKIRANKRQEMVIGGYTKIKNTSKAFSSLLMGVFEKGKLIYTGKVGTGFTDQQQAEMLKKFKPYIVKTSAFTELPDVNKPSRFSKPKPTEIIWLKPELVAEVEFTEMTSDGIMRHPSFKGMRFDKNAKDVVREKAVPLKKITGNQKNSTTISRPEKNHRKTFLNSVDETQVKEIEGHQLKFTNLSKIFWPKERITKRDMLNYYYQAAPYILPYLKDRPQSLNRHPNGITGKAFYQKDVTDKAPDWIKTYKYHSDNSTHDKHYMVATDESSVLYMASLACIEMNPWSSRVDSPDNPDWCIIDLDPGETPFSKAIEAAQVTHEILKSMNVDGYAKTSGSKGIHIYIPLGAKYTYEHSKEFARIIATLVQREIPRFTTIQRAVNTRQGKMYIDFLQNRPHATVAAAYSLRPKPGATVSMPLHWEEVKKGLKMTDFTIHNAIDRIKNEGDIFKPVLGKGINLEKVVNNFNK